MSVKYDTVSNFLNYESITDNKILLNICNDSVYGVTDSNEFYSRYYKLEDSFYNNKQKYVFGNNYYHNIFSYHIVCNMICVDWPKSFYNINPFKYNHFTKCIKKLNSYILNNNIKLILTPIFGKEILQGEWSKIMKIIIDNIESKTKIIIFKS